jgi:hypothetical protein
VKTKILLLAASLCGLLVQPTTFSQGVVYFLDNTNQPIDGIFSMGHDYGTVGAQFQTGANSGGYLFNQLEMQFADATGIPIFSGLSVAIFSNASYNAPGMIISSLQPIQNPLTAGLYKFTPITATTLESDTLYWMVIVIASASFNDCYNVTYTGTTDASSPDGWVFTGKTAIGQPGIPIFSIGATPVPEPSVVTIALVGGLWLFTQRKRFL